MTWTETLLCFCLAVIGGAITAAIMNRRKE